MGSEVTGGEVTWGDVAEGEVTGRKVTGGEVTWGEVTEGEVTESEVTGGDGIQRGEVPAGGEVTESEGSFPSTRMFNQVVTRLTTIMFLKFYFSESRMFLKCGRCQGGKYQCSWQLADAGVGRFE